MVNNFLKNNLAILFGNVFFKIGGYIYKFLMVYLLNNYAYGILTIISPFQNILQTLAAGGLPPTISKYVSEYNATNQKENSYKLILVSIKIAILLGITFGLLMIFFIAPLLVKIYNNNSLLLPIPVILTAISEIGIYSMTTTIMPLFITISEIGYFGIAEPIARLPLMISNSLATTILPVTSEMFASKNTNILKKYMFNALRYNLIIMVPICLFIMIFSKEVLLVMFFTKPFYSKGANVLTILTLGMFFYSIFAITSSMIQGAGKPKSSMYLLIGGFIQILLLSFIFIPYFGVNGGAISTTLTTATMTLISLIYLNKHISLKFNMIHYLKILFAGIIIAIFLLILPKNLIGFYIGLLFLFPIYLITLMIIKGFTADDLNILMKIENKLPFKLTIIKKMIIKGTEVNFNEYRK